MEMQKVSSSVVQPVQTTFSRSATKVETTPRGFIPGDPKNNGMQLTIIPDKVEITTLTAFPAQDAEGSKKIKERAKAVTEKKMDIDARIKDALDNAGYTANVHDNLKIEVDNSGKIVISGIKDRNMAKQIEQELNKDKKLAKDIKDFRMERSNLSVALKKETGQSLDDLQRRRKELDDPPRLTLALINANHPEKEGPKTTKDDLLAFNDVSLLAEDEELMGLVRGLVAPADMDYAAEKPGLVDPVGTLERTGRNIMQNVSYRFQEYNNAVRDKWKNDEEEIQRRVLRIEDFHMRVGMNGEIAVEGKFAQDPESNQAGINIIKSELEDTFIGYDFGADDSPLKTTMGRFFELHEDNFGDTDEFDHQLGFEIKNGGRSIEAYAYSPEAEAASTAEISASTTKYLEASGILKDKAQQLEFEVDEEGKIALTTPIADAELAEQVADLLDELNNGLAKATGKNAESTGESNGSALGNALAEITPHLKHVLSHRPGGGKLSVVIPDDDAKEDNGKATEKKDLFDKTLMMQKGTLPGTRAYFKPGIVRALERLA